MSSEGQHKVSIDSASNKILAHLRNQLLSANLEDADPAVYDIIQKVGLPYPRGFTKSY